MRATLTMDNSFFSTKRAWSRYKDYLLETYLPPYIAKVNHLGKPILIVDCFAGRGRFEDGSDGSPLIIARAVQQWREQGVVATARCVEADPGNFEILQETLSEHAGYVEPVHGTFEDVLPGLESEAEKKTVFLYVDPYTVKGLRFDEMERVYGQIRKSRSSVELLMNFNVGIFMRWALAAVKRWERLPDRAEFETMADDPDEHVERDELTSIAGGKYWITIAQRSGPSFEEKLRQFLSEYAKRLARSFEYVARFPVMEELHHRVPKYVMIFATRSPDGALLMNDNMCKARRKFVEDHLKSKYKGPTLFDVTPEGEVVERDELEAEVVRIISESNEPPTRRDVRLKLLPEGYFARLTQKEVYHVIGDLLKAKRLQSSTGKVRINDDVTLTVGEGGASQRNLF
ncbi:MAG: three-Cys-motif partner protein TcmP [Maioricimonas sp. JB049]